MTGRLVQGCQYCETTLRLVDFGRHLPYSSLVSTGLTTTLLVGAVSGHVAVNDAGVSTREFEGS